MDMGCFSLIRPGMQSKTFCAGEIMYHSNCLVHYLILKMMTTALALTCFPVTMWRVYGSGKKRIAAPSMYLQRFGNAKKPGACGCNSFSKMYFAPLSRTRNTHLRMYR